MVTSYENLRTVLNGTRDWSKGDKIIPMTQVKYREQMYFYRRTERNENSF